MGRYKRRKKDKKNKKKKIFVNTKMVLDFINKNLNKIENLPVSKLQIEKRDVELGDEWDSETGYEYLLFFPDKSAYLVGYVKIIEDREHYANPDSYENTYCRDYYQERSVTPIEIIEKLEKATFLNI